MNPAAIIMTTVLVISLLAPFAVYYGVKSAKKRDYTSHRNIQNTIYAICVLSVLALEILIRLSGGSGSLASQSQHYGKTFFTTLLLSHILVATLTYLTWTLVIILSNLKFRKTLPGPHSKLHKNLGITIFLGLIYTALTGLLVYLMTWNFL